jgi:hypothetical protein
MRRERRLQQLWPKHLASINNPTIVKRRTLVRSRKTHLRSAPQFRVFFNNCGKIPKRAGYPDLPLAIFQKWTRHVPVVGVEAENLGDGGQPRGLWGTAGRPALVR